MALRVKVAQKEGAVGMVEFVMPQQASKKPSTPNLPVTYYSRITSVTGSFFREIRQVTYLDIEKTSRRQETFFVSGYCANWRVVLE